MNIIVMLLFILLAVPLLGLPSTYDVWLVSILVIAILFFTYVLYVKNPLHKRVAVKDISKDDQSKKNKNIDKQQQKTESIIDSPAVLSEKEKNSIVEAVQKDTTKK